MRLISIFRIAPRCVACRRRSRWAAPCSLVLAAGALAGFWSRELHGAESAARRYVIPAGEASATLERFAQQTGQQIVYPLDAVRGVKTKEVVGEFTAKETLQRMLADSALQVIEDPGTGALAVSQKKAARRRARSDNASGSAHADEIVVLPEFSVSSTSPERYRPSDTMSFARVRGTIMDTPLSVSVVSHDLLQDVGANSLFDATRYFAGVSNGRGSGAGGINDRQNFRGFESYGRTVDGLSTFLIPSTSGSTSNFEPEFVERIEVVRGPDTILSPTGSSGGSMNVITKAPQYTPNSEVSWQVGNHNAGKTTLDTTGPLGQGSRWAYRVIANYQDGKTFVPGAIRQFDLNAQLAYQISDTAKLTMKYFGADWELLGAIANPNDNGWYVFAPESVRGATIPGVPPNGSGFSYKGWNGDAPWSRRTDRINMVTGEYTASLFDLVSMRWAGMFISDRFNQDAGYLSAPPPRGIYNPDTGEEIALSGFDPSALSEIAFHQVQAQHDEQLQNDYAGDFLVGEVSLRPVVGWTYQRGNNPYTTTTTAALPNNDLLSGAYYNPPHPAASDYTVATNTAGHAWQAQAYALLKMGFWSERLFVLSGVSRLWTKSSSTNLVNDSGVILKGKKDAYLAGILFRPTPPLSLYYTFSTNASISTGSATQPLWRTGAQNELGVKSEFFDQRLSLTAAHYTIDQTNLGTPNPLFNTDPSKNPQAILTDNANRGYEIELTGGLTSQLSVVANFTLMHLRDSYGRRPRNVPDRTSNLLLAYRFADGALKGLNLFCGLQHQGDSAGETVVGFTEKGVPQQPGFFIAPWTVCNVGAGYAWRRYRFNLNADNLFDRKFIWQPAGRNSVSPYPGLTVRFTTSIHF